MTKQGLSVLLMTMVVAAIVLVPAPRITQAQSQPPPPLVLTVMDPEAPLVGSQTPLFIMSNLGLIVYEQDGDYYSVLDQAPVVLSQFQIDESFYTLDHDYDLALMSDQPTYSIHIWREGQRHTVSVYGDVVNDEDVRGRTPPAFLHLFDQLMTYENERASLYSPTYVNVRVWPYETSDAALWPDDWPVIGAAGVQALDDGHYRFLLHENFISDLEALREATNAVRSEDGQTWAFTWTLSFGSEIWWSLDPDTPITNSQTAEFDPVFAGAKAVTWGTVAFPADEWTIYTTTTQDTVTVNFWHFEPNAVASYRLQHVEDSYDVEAVNNTINKEWLAQVLRNYEAWAIEGRCVAGDFVLVDLSLNSEGQDFVARYWAWSSTDGFHTILAVFGDGYSSDDLEVTADTLFGDAARCE